MGDGLRKATLDALCSRGPWSGCSWDPTSTWILTADELRALYAAVPKGRGWMEVAIHDGIGSNKGNRATQLLRRAGLIHYDRAARTWRQTGGSDVR